MIVYSHASDEWATPSEVFDPLHREFAFTLDVAATAINHKCDRYFTQEKDALKQSWANEVCWMNPPYSLIKPFLIKATTEVLAHPATTVVALLPARTDTRWFHAYCYGIASEIRFLKGRVKFINPGGPLRTPTASVISGKHAPNNGAPFASMVVIWG